MATERQLEGFHVTVEGDKFTLVEGSKTYVVHFALSPDAKPHVIEFYKTVDKKEKMWHGIYEFEGKELKLCWGPAGRPRPKDFESSKADDAPQGELGFKAARWRVEMYLGTGTSSGHRSRDGDFHLRTAVDYEIPVLKHMTVAPRLLPLTYINEAGSDGQTLYAFGFGVAVRGYSNGDEQRGWFGEGSLNVLAQTDKFTGNSGTVNFMEELGVGYMFKSRWHLAAKFNHMSNAGLASENAGLNSAGLGVGYTFRTRRAH